MRNICRDIYYTVSGDSIRYSKFVQDNPSKIDWDKYNMLRDRSNAAWAAYLRSIK